MGGRRKKMLANALMLVFVLFIHLIDSNITIVIIINEAISQLNENQSSI